MSYHDISKSLPLISDQIEDFDSAEFAVVVAAAVVDYCSERNLDVIRVVLSHYSKLSLSL